MNTENAGHVTATKEEICTLLRAFINTRPGLDFRNYGTASSYRGEVRRITRQRADALQLLRAVELRDSIEVDELIAAFPRIRREIGIDTEKRKAGPLLLRGPILPNGIPGRSLRGSRPVPVGVG
jgi:hypothetical protein